MTSAAPSLINAAAATPPQRSATAELVQETLALTRRLFLQLARRPSTLVAGVLQPLIWLVLFGALFANAPEGLLPDGMSYGRFLGAGVIVFTAFSAALNAGLPVMFDREFGFLNRLLVAPLRSRSSIVLASVLYITALSLVQSVAIMATAWALGYGWPGGACLLLVLVGQLRLLLVVELFLLLVGLVVELLLRLQMLRQPQPTGCAGCRKRFLCLTVSTRLALLLGSSIKLRLVFAFQTQQHGWHSSWLSMRVVPCKQHQELVWLKARPSLSVALMR